jgi:hypothetical protein
MNKVLEIVFITACVGVLSLFAFYWLLMISSACRMVDEIHQKLGLDEEDDEP